MERWCSNDRAPPGRCGEKHGNANVSDSVGSSLSISRPCSAGTMRGDDAGEGNMLMHLIGLGTALFMTAAAAYNYRVTKE